MTAAAEHLSGNVGRWFDSVMDRVSQRFVLHMRLWTVLFSILVAFALHLDAFRLFWQLSSDAELRARLIASADGLTRKADEILVTSTNAPMAAFVDAEPDRPQPLPYRCGKLDDIEAEAIEKSARHARLAFLFQH